MSDTPTLPKSPVFERLKLKLCELFELDKADLEFGIYRILHQRRDEIQEFLDNHLARTVYDALQSQNGVQQDQVQDELQKIVQTTQAAGFDSDRLPAVDAFREKLAGAANIDAIADEVYSHLYTFFSRYYENGDFLDLQRPTIKGRERYMIPYHGEEVKLIWANMDQYYIKSSELLRDYSFCLHQSDFAPGRFEWEFSTQAVIHFKLVEGNTKKDTIQPESRSVRAFALSADQPFEQTNDTTLYIYLTYHEYPNECNLQDKLLADAEKVLADYLPARWRQILFAPDPKYHGKDKSETCTWLHKHLRGYTAKFAYGYFIHKDLGGFLRQELDSYIMNEVMHLDDIEDMSAAKAAEYLSKVCAIRRCAMPIIRMLAQFQEFQKKLWLKKKFVMKTRFCLTVDQIPETQYEEICANDAQFEEWEQLYALSDMPNDLVTANPRTPEFLKQQPYLMVDTRHFSRDFTLKLLSSIDNLDESFDGVCFHSENFQALQVMQGRYREQIKCVYLDPPYNTSSSSILYKNNYKHSSWGTMMFDRMVALRAMMNCAGVVFVSIDKLERTILEGVLDSIFGRENRVEELVWTQNTANSQLPTYSTNHEYIEIYARHLETIEKTLGMFREKKPGDSEMMGIVAQHNPSYPPSAEVEPSTKELFKKHVLEFKDEIEVACREWDGEAKPDTWKGVFNYWRNDGEEEVSALFGASGLFLSPKSTKFVRRFIAQTTENGDWVVDCFGGSGSSAHAVINLNRDTRGSRKYVICEMGPHFESLIVPRLKKAAYSPDWQNGKPQMRNSGFTHAFKILELESYEDTLSNLRLNRTPQQDAILANSDNRHRSEYMLGYSLDFESADAASLLDVTQFRDPFNYQLQTVSPSSGETQSTPVDLVETFNWLIGLKIKHIDVQKGYLAVTGERLVGGRTLILWRTLSDDPIADNEAMKRYLEQLNINPIDTEFEFIYVNGPHILNDPHNKVHPIEEEFRRRMFETEAFESLSYFHA